MGKVEAPRFDRKDRIYPPYDRRNSTENIYVCVSFRALDEMSTV